jgi:hypothetical protein
MSGSGLVAGFLGRKRVYLGLLDSAHPMELAPEPRWPNSAYTFELFYSLFRMSKPVQKIEVGTFT